MDIQKYKFIALEPETDKELWKKELRLILNRDIHEKSLGCCVNNTHIKIGNVHLGTFYEAQFLFGNAYWISIFSHALKNKIKLINGISKKKILIIGYETYIEPVILQTLKAFKDEENKYNIDFCIYEEPKFILNNQKSEVRFRFECDNNKCKYDEYIIICGVASTLSTYTKIIKKVVQNMNPSDDNESLKTKFVNMIEKTHCYTIIQVLPNELNTTINNRIYTLENTETNRQYLVYDPKNTLVERRENNDSIIKATYLTEVFCEWQNAQDCKWCFNQIDERPLITTNETSVIPVQMIGTNRNGKYSSLSNLSTKENDKINIFQKNSKGQFIYLNYLYYNHTERDSHHYQYYIRTSALLNYIVSNREENGKLTRFCDNIKTQLFTNGRSNRIDILVVPIHYSNEHFMNIITQRVFDNSVEIISFDPQKEFRSNFETKYSNYAYILEATKSERKTRVYFHYIDDQIITGNTFYRAKSFVSSLVRRSQLEKIDPNSKQEMQIFNSIITLIDRNSRSSRLNYIDNENNFFSLIEVEIPSLRNHGDSCYLCSKSKNAEQIKKNSALFKMSDIWEEKEKYHRIKTLQEVRNIHANQPEYVKERKFRQFYCENLIWKSLKDTWETEKDIYKKLVNIMYREVSTHKKINAQYEYLISFIKVISKPFLYYRENFKKAVYPILQYLTHMLNESHNISPKSMLTILKNIDCEDGKLYFFNLDKKYFDNYELCQEFNEEKYYLYVILLSNLCSINSSYLVKYDNIIKALTFYEDLCEQDNSLKCREIMPMASRIRSSLKFVTNGISGVYKAKFLDDQLKSNSTCNCKYNELIQKIYLENLESQDDLCTNEKKDTLRRLIAENISSLRKKYSSILKYITQESKAWLIVQFQKPEKNFLIATSGNLITPLEIDKKISTLYHSSNEEDVITTQNYTYILCCAYQESSKIYLVVQNKHKSNKGENNFKNLDFIRSILTFRYILTTELIVDIKSGAIKELYDDDKFLDILTHPKTITHGNSEDITKHLSNIENKFLLFASHGDKLNDQFYDITTDLTLFSNILISFLHSCRISDELGKKHKFKDYLQLNPINSICLPENITPLSVAPNEIDFEQNSKIDLNGTDMSSKFMERFNLYKQCLKKNYAYININEFDVSAEAISHFIGLSLQDENAIWIPIAFIHILVRNAQQHALPGSTISLHFDKRGDSYDLTVKNPWERTEFDFNNGITLKALTHAFDNNPHFKISIPKSRASEFIVTITNFATVNRVLKEDKE